MIFNIRKVYQGELPDEGVAVKLDSNESPLFMYTTDKDGNGIFTVLAVAARPTEEELANARQVASKVSIPVGTKTVNVDVDESKE